MKQKRMHVATADRSGDCSRNSPALQQERGKNDRGRSRYPAGNHQKPGKAVAGKQQYRCVEGTQQECSKTTGSAAGTQKEIIKNLAEL